MKMGTRVLRGIALAMFLGGLQANGAARAQDGPADACVGRPKEIAAARLSETAEAGKGGVVRAELPDTPRPKQDVNAPAPNQEKRTGQGPLRLIARRSFFYPELAASPGPLGVKQKFELFLAESISPARILSAAAAAGISQGRDSLSGYGEGGGGYAARFGSSTATGASSYFFGTFLLPSMLRQDPRYFVRGQGSFAQRVGYALRRTVVTRTDSGREAFNWPGILGPLAAEGLANTYLPSAEQTPGKTFGRYGIRIGFGAANNLVKEYWPTIFKSLGMRRVAPGLGPETTPASPPAGDGPARGR